MIPRTVAEVVEAKELQHIENPEGQPLITKISWALKRRGVGKNIVVEKFMLSRDPLGYNVIATVYD